MKTNRDPHPSASTLHSAGDKVFIHLHRNDGVERLVVTDGTSAGTLEVGKVEFGIITSATTLLNGKWLYGNGWIDEGEHGWEPWVSDGTVAGTHLLKDINPGVGSSAPSRFVRFGDKMYFIADDGVHNRQLWVTDGTEQGTVMLSNISYEPTGIRTELAEVNGKLAVTLRHMYTDEELRTYVFDPLTDTTPRGPAQSALRLDGDRLRVTGTSGVDVIKFYRMNDGERFSVSINGGAKRAFRFDAVARIIVYSYSGDDTIIVNEKYGIFKERLFVWGGDGDDVIFTGSAVDRVAGGEGNDVIRTSRGDDTLVGGGGDDRLIGGAGVDLISGGFGSDWLDPGAGSDVLFGQPVYDTFFGDRKNDGEPIDEDDVIEF